MLWIILVFWIFKLVAGVVDSLGRHVPVYEDAVEADFYIGQVGFSVVIPFAFVLLNFTLIFFAKKIHALLVVIVAAMQIFMLLSHTFHGYGGV
ncbi:MAG: hypothetical protein GAK31_02074 [Stenotrophomonas maltophilia]|uniref:Transmembrane protein n=1 Tax=Stenotrophomonas maltophilia TaxID=40324 RepID=A0A7V8FFJ2_STEMA|nr:MAG: hypothetical protein GAK31_02074 [Stenotrophomonas maltophilia]